MREEISVSAQWQLGKAWGKCCKALRVAEQAPLIGLAGLLILFFSWRSTAEDRPGPGGALSEVSREALCITNGAVGVRPDGQLEVTTPSSRAVVRDFVGHSAELRFRYLGPSPQTKPLASGEVRRQIGLKLRAQDSCNLLYVMWHIEPDSNVVVSIKRNAGKHTHEECGAHGYTTLQPRTGTQLPKLRPGEAHWLRAELRGTELGVTADGRLAWSGPVGQQVLDFDGPVGFRTDNVAVAFSYFAQPLSSPGRAGTAQAESNLCRPSSGD